MGDFKPASHESGHPAKEALTLPLETDFSRRRHEIDDALSIISNQAELLASRLASSEYRREVDEIVGAAFKLRGLLHLLQSAARG